MNLSWHNTGHLQLWSRLTYLYMSCCPLLKFRFPDFSFSSFDILICLHIIQVKFYWNLLGPVGDMYCFSNTYSMLVQQYEVSLSRMLNDILILVQQWLPNQLDFPPILWHLYRAWPSPIMSGFHGAFATGVAYMYQQGTLTLPDTWFRPPFWTCLYSNCWDQIPRTCHVFNRLFTSNTPWYFVDFFFCILTLFGQKIPYKANITIVN